jgi:hypothetical protein
VFRGLYNLTDRYYYNANRRDIVAYTGGYWMTNNPSKDAQANWGTPGVGPDWLFFGSAFSMIATGLLLTENAIITVSLTLGTYGTNVGYIQSANYVAGVSGFLIRADGYAEFNDVVIRGDVSTTSGKFNPADPTRTMPPIGYVYHVLGAVPDADIPVNPTKLYSTDDNLIFYGWNSGPASFITNRFGLSNQPFSVNLQGNASGITGALLYANFAYRVRDGGGGWSSWNEIGFNALLPAAAEASFQKTNFAVVGLTGTMDIQFAAVWSKGAGGAANIGGAEISVQALN